ncbi:MAG: RNA polymerase sigma factor [Gemmataceae bacterium]
MAEAPAEDGQASIPVELVLAARSGSREALGRLLDVLRDELVRLAQAGLAPDLRAKAGASDLVQQTFLEAQRDIGQFDGNTIEELRGWLKAILMHNLTNFARQYRRSKRQVDREVPLAAAPAALDPVLATPSPSSKAITREQAAALEAALARLPDEYRLVLRLREEEKKSFADIGAALERSAEAARKLWARALQRLKQEMGESP